MKKFTKLAGLALLVMLAIGFAGCSSDSDSGTPAAPESHEHTYAEELSKDAAGHWYAATCEHTTEKKDFAEHTFGEWRSNGDATTEADGTKSRTCEACNYVDTVADVGSKLTPVTSCLGSKTPDAAKTVGDIVFNDGSSTPYTSELTLSDAQKAAAIAVIFKAEGDKTLGVGLKHDCNGLAWCTSSAKAYSKNITTIQCPASGSAGNLTFTGDTDGSDNLEQIATFLGEENDTTGKGAKDRYPAFYYAKNYKDVTGSNVKDTDYAEGWYLPTIAELFDVWKVKATVDAASELCGGSKFGTSFYWSSSQYASSDTNACRLYFDEGDWNHRLQDFSYYVCCIRAFN